MSSNPRPLFRRLRTYAFDPSASTDLSTAIVNEAVLKVRWEPLLFDGPSLTRGPAGEYVEVVDFDPASGAFYPPVDLNDPYLLAQDGHAPSEGNPQFHQQMVYAVAMMTIRHFEHGIGRKVLWSPRFDDSAGRRGKPQYVQRLRIYPHALREANAYYSPSKKALLFGYFPASVSDPGRNLPGGLVFTCLSHDIIAHETTHAILDGMHRRYIEATNPDALAFHEAFADIVALFQHFTLPESVRHQLAKSRGDLSQRTLLSGLARQFGEAIGSYGSLREAIDKVDPKTGEPDPTLLNRTAEPHARGAILVAAVFDAFVTIYRTRIADLLRLTTGTSTAFPESDLHPDLLNRLTAEANKSAAHVLRMCIRALDYLPPVDITFGDYLQALVTADYDLVQDDDLGYRIAMVEAFRRRGIYPGGVRSLAVDSLLWMSPRPKIGIDIEKHLDSTSLENREHLWMQSEVNCRNLWWWLSSQKMRVEPIFRQLGLRLDRNAPATIGRSGIDKRPRVEVHSVRFARRSGPDGQQVRQVIIEMTQSRDGYRDPEVQLQQDAGKKPRRQPDFIFRGGCTVIIDLRSGEVRYAVAKSIMSDNRLDRTRRFMFQNEGASLAATYFGPQRGREPLAFLHRHG